MHPRGELKTGIDRSRLSAGQLREPCRRLSQDELNELAPNLRKLDDCPRELTRH